MRGVVWLSLLVLGLAAPAAGAAAGAGEEWRWPLRGPLVGAFDYRSEQPFAGGQHRGIDIAAPAGMSVRAACGGRVAFAGTAGGSGRTVSVRCGGLVATYLHLESIAVRAGGIVSAGDRLGRVGTSGRPRLRTPHLHLGARRASVRWAYVDPLALLGGDPALPDAGPSPGFPRVAPQPLPARIPRGLGRAPAPVPWRVRVPSPVLARPLPAAVPPPGRSLPWPVWAGAALLALAIPLPAVRRRRRAGLGSSRSARSAARGAQLDLACPREHGSSESTI